MNYSYYEEKDRYQEQTSRVAVMEFGEGELQKDNNRGARETCGESLKQNARGSGLAAHVETK